MYQFLNLIFLFVGNPIMPEIRSTTGNKCSFIGSNTFIGIDEYNSNYIRRYPKPMNIFYIHRCGPGIDEYRVELI
jgi:hypothetical protein